MAEVQDFYDKTPEELIEAILTAFRTDLLPTNFDASFVESVADWVAKDLGVTDAQHEGLLNIAKKFFNADGTPKAWIAYYKSRPFARRFNTTLNKTH